MHFQQSVLLSVLSGLAAANTPPPTIGMKMLWSEEFRGEAGGKVNGDVWNVMEFIDTNNEAQTYTTSTANLQTSGGGTAQFVPVKGPDGRWTSGRIETKDSWTPQDGKVTMIAASLLMGTTSRDKKQGFWPAFWTLGDSMRHGTEWPWNGELDIFEQISGGGEAYGTVHCMSGPVSDVVQGGPCQETTGLASSTPMPADGQFSTWSLKIDRTNPDWLAQTITWEHNGAPFKVLHGADIGDLPTWASLAHSPLYILLNVAVGGDWPGPPNDATMGGYGSMMEVEWVGVWTS